MTEAQILQAISEALHPIAPEVDCRGIRPDENLRAAVDIDSFDFLNFLIALHSNLGVQIPESDYGQIQTLGGLIKYLSGRAGSPEPGAPQSVAKSGD